MIIDLILLAVQGLLEILLLPLSGINIAVDFLGSIPIVFQFLQVVAYIFPWDNLVPLFILIISLISFRTVVALVRLVFSII